MDHAPFLLVGLLPAAALASACASTISTEDLPRTRSEALPPAEDSPLGQLFAPTGGAKSLFASIDHGSDGLDVRLALARNAASSIDVQSYLWHPDACGSFVFDTILAAADRGVRVRLLIDGFRLERNRDAAAALSMHPNLELRVFNPTYHRGGLWAAVETVENLGRLDHRMHNKMFVVDGVVAVYGGRNIGDEYFGLGDELNMRDFDVLTSGDVVGALEVSFDAFWNSEWAIPVEDLASRDGLDEEAIAEVRQRVTARHMSEARLDERRALDANAWMRALRRARAGMVAGRATVIHDEQDIASGGATGAMARAFEDSLDETEGDALLVTAYLVPDERLLGWIRRHTAAGQRVQILTNSYRSTNQPLAHAYYAPTRRALLEAGAELYELRPDAWSHVHHRMPAADADGLCLHAKSAVFGRDTVVVGSMNLDPRSMVLNTELGVIVESEDLATAVRAALEREIADRNAWRVTLDEDGRTRWTSQGRVVDEDPDMPASEELREWFVRLLPLRGEV